MEGGLVSAQADRQGGGGTAACRGDRTGEDTPWAQASPAFEKIERFKEITTPLKAERELLTRLNKLLGHASRGRGGRG